MGGREGERVGGREEEREGKVTVSVFPFSYI